MYVFRWEDITKFAKYGLQECHCLRVTSTENLTAYTPIGTYRIRASCASKMWEYMQSTLHMTGKVYLRNYIDIALSGIANNLAALLLSIISSIGSAIIDTRIARAYDRFSTHTSQGSKAWICLHLETPSLVFSKMPMELVTAMQSHNVKELLYELHGKIVSSAIKKYATILETWFVEYLGIGKFHLVGILDNRK
jgi:hypothetical protein